MRSPFLPGLALAVLAAGSARAHSFASGSDFYQQFIEGAGVIFTYPALLLPTLALGILLSLWDLDGLKKVWLLFIAALLAGVLLGALVGPAVTIVLMAVGIVTATLAAVLSSHRRAVTTALTGLTGLLVSATALEGHALFAVALGIHLGIFFAANIALAWSAAVVRMILDNVDAAWTRIGARILASWTGAVLVLMIAFALSNP